MFLKTNLLKRLMKQAYAGGGLIAAGRGDWIYISGSYWEIEAEKGYISKKTMGDLISLIGELPEDKERFQAGKDGNQMEMETPMGIVTDLFDPRNRLTVTDLILLHQKGVEQRILQDADTGTLYLLNNLFVDMVDNECIEEGKGETGVSDQPMFHPKLGVLWDNGHCRMHVLFRDPEEILESLQGIPLIPEVKR